MNELDELIEEYFEGVLERNPHVATVLGFHRFDGDVPDGSAHSIEQEIDEVRDLLNDIEGFESSRARLVKSSLEFDLYLMDELRLWRKRPNGADAVISLLYPLYIRDFDSLDKRLELIAERLEDIPEFLIDVRGRLDEPIDLWVNKEREQINELPGFFQLIADEAGEIERQDIAYRINSAAEDTIDELDQYSEWLESSEKDSDWRIGEESLNELLRKRLLPDPDRIKNEAETVLDKADNAINDALNKLDIEDKEQAIQQIQSEHPMDFQGILDSYTDKIREKRRAVAEKELIDIPLNDEFQILETPSYMEGVIGDIGYIEPSPFNKEENARLYITEPRTASELESHNESEVESRSITDFYPGRHLLMSYRSLNPDPITEIASRFNAFGDEFRHGWELYSEYLMSQQKETEPEYELVRSRNLVQEACSCIVDIELQRNNMNIRDAAQYLVDEAGLSEQYASSVVIDYTMNPAHQVSGVIGYRLLKKLRSDALSNGYTDRELHNELMENPGLPVRLQRERIGL